MNTINNQTLPYMPTEIWDKIYDVKEAMEEEDKRCKEVHKALMEKGLHGSYSVFYMITTAKQKHILGSICGRYDNAGELRPRQLASPANDHGDHWMGEKWSEWVRHDDGSMHLEERDGEFLCRECVDEYWWDERHQRATRANGDGYEHINHGLPGHKQSRDTFFEELETYWL